jgi:hypothetical protein
MGHLLKLKYALGTHECTVVRILALTSVPFRPTMVQMPNSALFATKRIIYSASKISNQACYCKSTSSDACVSNICMLCFISKVGVAAINCCLL